MSWKLLPKLEFEGGRKSDLENVVLYKGRKGVRIYFPAKLRRKLGNPGWCNLYVDGTRLLIQFTEDPQQHTRKIDKTSYVRLPVSLLAVPLHKLFPLESKRRELVPEIKKGNLIIDLDCAKNDT